MITKKGIDKIIEAYKQGELLKASQVGKGFFKELPKKVQKIVEVANFLTGSIFSGNIKNVIDYTSHYDVILAKYFFLEGDFEKYRDTVYKVLETTEDNFSKLYCLKEIKMFNGKDFSNLYPKYSGIEITTKRSEYLRKFLENNYKGTVKDISDFISEKSHIEILLDLADIWYYTEQYKELSELCLSMYREGKINDYFLYLYSYSLFSSGRIPDAINILEKIVKKYPRNVNIVYNLAVSYYRNGNIEKAEELIRICEKEKDAPEIHFAKGIFLYYLNKYDESKKEFLKTKEFEEFQFSSEYNASICDYKMKNYEEAIARLVKLRNEKFVDRKNFEAIDRTIHFIKNKSRKTPYYILILLLFILSIGLGITIYFILSFTGLRWIYGKSKNDVRFCLTRKK